MDYETLLYEIIDESIALITLNRPEKYNALNLKTIDELEDVFKKAGSDPVVKVVLITGAGKSFIAGADINEFVGRNADGGHALARRLQSVFSIVDEMDKPVIAAINGFALGGGCELASSVDIRLASDKAKIGQPEINLGLIPGAGGTQRLTKLVGRGWSSWLIFTGDHISAEQALQIGLVDAVYPAEELMDRARELARKIASKPAIALKNAKSAIRRATETDIETGLLLEAKAFGLCFATEDVKEGVSAFLEKRKAQFRDR
ncbi:MAG: enoyl-CoA hydratase/isomerase family protein [Candidatus Odinarchaeota archaeon]